MTEGDLRRHFAAAAVVAEVQLDLGVARYKLVRRLRVGEFHKPSMGSVQGWDFMLKESHFFEFPQVCGVISVTRQNPTITEKH